MGRIDYPGCAQTEPRVRNWGGSRNSECGQSARSPASHVFNGHLVAAVDAERTTGGKTVESTGGRSASVFFVRTPGSWNQPMLASEYGIPLSAIGVVSDYVQWTIPSYTDGEIKFQASLGK